MEATTYYTRITFWKELNGMLPNVSWFVNCLVSWLVRMDSSWLLLVVGASVG